MEANFFAGVGLEMIKRHLRSFSINYLLLCHRKISAQLLAKVSEVAGQGFNFSLEMIVKIQGLLLIRIDL